MMDDGDAYASSRVRARLPLPRQRSAYSKKPQMVVFMEPLNATADALANVAVRQYAAGFGVYGVLSHLVFVPTIVRAAMFRNAVVVVLLLALTLPSTFYHACQAFNTCGGIAEEDTRRIDHTTAPLAILIGGWFVVNALGMRTTAKRYAAFVSSVLPVQVLVVALAVQLHPFDAVPAIVAAMAVVFGIYAYVVFFRVEPYRDDDDDDLRRWPIQLYWIGLFGAAVLGSVGVLFFILDDASTLLHSHWHVFVGLALCLLQESVYNRVLVNPRTSG